MSLDFIDMHHVYIFVTEVEQVRLKRNVRAVEDAFHFIEGQGSPDR